MAVIDSAYHYYLSTYAKLPSSRHDTHKRSELRSVYNRILKINKESPLYRLERSSDVPRFLIDIKENARQVKNVVASLSEHGEDLENAFQKKVAVSSDEDIVSASYIGNGSSADNAKSFDIEIRQLAEPQVNLGNFLERNELDIIPDDYSFDLTMQSGSYEFQFSVNYGDTNRSVLEKLARLVNSSKIGLDAEVLDDDKNRCALKISSKQTGLSENQSALFQINPSATANSIHAMDILGIQHITSPASNSSFILNGEEQHSYSNTFTVQNSFELTLRGISPEDVPAHIGFKTSIDAVADNLQELINAYNDFIETGTRYSSTPQGNHLLRDIKSVSYSYRNNLESIGMLVDTDGSVSLDRSLLASALDTPNPETAFSVLNEFKNSLFAKANNASLDPVQYVNKIIVTYKRPHANFVSPYASSIYAGMMLDRYC